MDVHRECIPFPVIAVSFCACRKSAFSGSFQGFRLFWFLSVDGHLWQVWPFLSLLSCLLSSLCPLLAFQPRAPNWTWCFWYELLAAQFFLQVPLLNGCASLRLVPYPSYNYNFNVCLLGSHENMTFDIYTSMFCVWILNITFICCNNIAAFILLPMAHKQMHCAILSVDYPVQVFPFPVSNLDMISLWGLWLTVTSFILGYNGIIMRWVLVPGTPGIHLLEAPPLAASLDGNGCIVSHGDCVSVAQNEIRDPEYLWCLFPLRVLETVFFSQDFHLLSPRWWYSASQPLTSLNHISIPAQNESNSWMHHLLW